MRAINQLIGNPIPKNIDQIIKESIKMRYPFQHFSTVMISDKDRTILGIAQSKRNNLILNQLGTLLAGLFRTPVVGSTSVSIVNDANVANQLYTYGTATAGSIIFNINGGGGTQIQVGSGSTPAARADYAIETAFGTAPEDDYFDTGAGAYAAGAIAIAGVIVAGGAGTINETLLSGYWWDETTNAYENHTLFHDILASGEAFVMGNTITVTYTLNL